MFENSRSRAPCCCAPQVDQLSAQVDRLQEQLRLRVKEIQNIGSDAASSSGELQAALHRAREETEDAIQVNLFPLERGSGSKGWWRGYSSKSQTAPRARRAGGRHPVTPFSLGDSWAGPGGGGRRAGPGGGTVGRIGWLGDIRQDWVGGQLGRPGGQETFRQDRVGGQLGRTGWGDSWADRVVGRQEGSMGERWLGRSLQQQATGLIGMRTKQDGREMAGEELTTASHGAAWHANKAGGNDIHSFHDDINGSGGSMDQDDIHAGDTIGLCRKAHPLRPRRLGRAATRSTTTCLPRTHRPSLD
eukprot:351581-Chlamydomonas_euryale.AAC.2